MLSTRQGKTADDGLGGQGSPFARAFASVLPTLGLRIEDAYARIRSTDTHGEQVPDTIRSDLPEGGVVIQAALDHEGLGNRRSTASAQWPPSGDMQKRSNSIGFPNRRQAWPRAGHCSSVLVDYHATSALDARVKPAHDERQSSKDEALIVGRRLIWSAPCGSPVIRAPVSGSSRGS